MAATKPHILFVGQRWCDGKPERGIANCAHNFWGPLEASRIATQDHVLFDDHLLSKGGSADGLLIEKCITERPDLIFLSWMHQPGRLNPKLETLLTIREDLRIPVIAWWGDTSMPPILKMAETLSHFVDWSIISDSTKTIARIKDPERFRAWIHPKDPHIFNDPSLERDIDVSFVGSAEMPYRKALLKELANAGITVSKFGGQREQGLSPEDFARYLQRSQIVINMLDPNTGVDCINGRLIEATMCGALLLEPEWSDAKAWLEPYVHYVPYSDTSDLVAKIQHYLNNEAERSHISRAGREVAQSRFSGPEFFGGVIELAQQAPLDVTKARVGLARRSLSIDRVDDALRWLAPLLAANDPFAMDMLGQIHLKQGSYSKACKAFEQARAGATSAATVLRLTFSLSQVGALEEARSVLQTILPIPPNSDHELYFWLGEVLANFEMYEESLLAYSEAFTRKQNNSYYCSKLVEVMLRTGQLQEALTFMDEMVKNLAHQPEVLERICNVLSLLPQSESIESGIQSLREAVARPDTRSVEEARLHFLGMWTDGELGLAVSYANHYLERQKDRQLLEEAQALNWGSYN